MVLVLIGIIIFSFLFLRSPFMQTYLGRVAAKYLGEMTQTEILIDRIRIDGYRKATIKGLSAKDHQNNPFISVEKLEASVKLLKIGNNQLFFKYLMLDSLYFAVVTYEGEEESNLEKFLSKLVPEKPRDTAAKAWTFGADELDMIRSRFRLEDQNREYDRKGMDFKDLDVSSIELEVSDVAVIGDSISAGIRWLSANEKSGFELREFRANADVSNSGIKAQELFILTSTSTLTLDLRFIYESFDAFSSFVEEVTIEAFIEPSHLQMSDIGYFAPELLIMENDLKISGDMKGTVSDFSADNFRFSFGQATKFKGDIKMRGLPDIKSTYADLDIDYFFSNKEDISDFALPVEGTYLDIPGEVARLGDFKIEGRFRGYYNDFTSAAEFATDVGTIKTNIKVAKTEKFESITYSGGIRGKGFDLGTLLAVPDLGTLNFNIEVEGRGLTMNSANLNMTGWIDSIMYQGNAYDELILGGKFSKNRFEGGLYLHDELAELDFNGLIDFSTEIPNGDFTAEVKRARLYEMNLSERAEDQNLQAKLTADISFVSFDTISGNLSIRDLIYTENKEEYLLDSMNILLDLGEGYDDSLVVVSDVFNANMHGEFGLGRIYPAFMTTLNSFVNDSLDAPAGRPHFTFEVEILKTQDLLDIFIPGMMIADSTKIEGYVDAPYNVLNVFIRSDTLEYKNNRLMDLQMTAEGRDGMLNFRLLSEKLQFREGTEEKNRPELAIQHLNLGGKLELNEVEYTLKWDDRESGNNKGDIQGVVQIMEDFRIEARLDRVEATVDGRDWTISEGNQLVIDSSYIGFKDFNLSTQHQEIYIDGAISARQEDTLNVSFSDWQLSNFEPIIAVEGLTLSGFVTGDLAVSNPYGNPVIFSDLYIDSLTFNGERFGESRIRSDWIPEEEAFRMDAEIFQQGNVEEAKTLDLKGVYYPLRDEERFAFDFKLQNFQVGVLQPFLTGVFSEFRGYASGSVAMSDGPDHPVLEGSLNLMRGEFLIGYLGVTYSMADKILFTPEGIFFEEVTVFDPRGGKAIMSGGIKHDFFNSFELDLTIKPENFMGMQTTRYENETVYGTAVATGEVRIYGPTEDITIDIDATSNKGTNVFIPIATTVDVTQSDFIIFIGDSAQVEEQEREYRVEVEGLTMNLDLDVTPDADIQLFLPSDMGYIKANGSGEVNMGIDSRGYFTINGEYVLRKGLFNFTLEQLVSKRFEIISGSSMRWTGDIYDAQINLRARYRTKTTLDGLGINLPEAGQGERVNVFLYIHLTENLFDPTLSFSIEFPYLSDNMKQTVYAVLDTSDAAIMNQQALSLLVLNSFSSAGTSSATEFNSYSVLSNQLSNLLSKISSDFDIGVNYNPGDEISSEELEVALSTQLFDDRLIIDGAFDVPTDQSGQQSSSLVGDVNIEYKLTPDGNIRVKAFNRSNNLNTLEQYAPYTQGIGIFYRKEFENLNDLFSRKKEKKKMEDQEE